MLGMAPGFFAFVGCHNSSLGMTTPAWIATTTPDSQLALRLPSVYHLRNTYGCWGHRDGIWPALSDFCLTVASSEKADSQAKNWVIPCSKDRTHINSDAACYNDARIDTVRYDNRSAIVIRAFLSGTMGHYQRLPALFVRLPLDSTTEAILTGTYRDQGGDAELIVIAGTVHRIPPK